MTITGSMMEMYVEQFHKSGEAAIKAICGSEVAVEVVLTKYKSLEPIETLPEKEKAELKEYVIDLFPGRSVDFLMNAAKIVYTIGNCI